MPDENVAPSKHARRRHPHRRAEFGNPAAERGIQKVHGVVRDADEEVDDCDDTEEGEHHEIVAVHRLLTSLREVWFLREMV
ncbi:MAG: hypothetical protein V8T46_10225 [Sutterella seckii]